MEQGTTMGDSRVALVTGANKGIGRAIAEALSDCGVRVFVGSRDRSRGEQALSEMEAPGRRLELVEIDVTSPDSVAAAVRQIAELAGRLDILVNNAGIACEPPSSLPSTLTAEVIRATYETNVLGVVTVTNACLPLLRESPAGRIVNCSSETGSKSIWSDPHNPMSMFAPLVPAYSSSKAALNSLTVAYAKELKDTPIKVNAVSPGHIGTDLNGGAGPGTPAEGAAVVVPFALLDDNGPTGGFFGTHGPVPW